MDEDPGVLAFLTMLFEEQGVRVLRARSCSEMREILERNYIPVDLILLDGAMETPDTSARRIPPPLMRMSAFVESGVIRVGGGVLQSAMSALGTCRARTHA